MDTANTVNNTANTKKKSSASKTVTIIICTIYCVICWVVLLGICIYSMSKNEKVLELLGDDNELVITDGYRFSEYEPGVASLEAQSSDDVAYTIEELFTRTEKRRNKSSSRRIDTDVIEGIGASFNGFEPYWEDWVIKGDFEYIQISEPSYDTKVGRYTSDFTHRYEIENGTNCVFINLGDSWGLGGNKTVYIDAEIDEVREAIESGIGIYKLLIGTIVIVPPLLIGTVAICDRHNKKKRGQEQQALENPAVK